MVHAASFMTRGGWDEWINERLQAFTCLTRNALVSALTFLCGIRSELNCISYAWKCIPEAHTSYSKRSKLRILHYKKIAYVFGNAYAEDVCYLFVFYSSIRAPPSSEYCWNWHDRIYGGSMDNLIFISRFLFLLLHDLLFIWKGKKVTRYVW